LLILSLLLLMFHICHSLQELQHSSFISHESQFWYQTCNNLLVEFV
jgi:hypothetical protein